jgi:hypothetical protein
MILQTEERLHTPMLSIPTTEIAAFGRWITIWVLLPTILLWLAGAPPREAEIVVGALIGLVLRRAPYAVSLAAFGLLMGYAMLALISSLFNLSIGSLLYSLKFLAEIRPGLSSEYVIGGAGLVVALMVAARTLRRPVDFAHPLLLTAAAASAVGAAGVDRWLSSDMRGSYARIAAAGTPFASATNNSGFAKADRRTHLLLVMVESLGVPKDAQVYHRLFQPMRQPAILDRFTLTGGTAPYFGSTTSGEVRELCGYWGEYHDLLKQPNASCMPALLAKKGYATTAVHSFTGDFFDRLRWYPNIGFQNRMFGDDLMRQGAQGCPGVFPGACDRDVPAIIGAQLKRSDGDPQFVYWLSVNSHLPVPPNDALGTMTCPADEMAAIAKHPMMCRQFILWDSLQSQLAKMLSDPDLPPTDVLIVGDHMPPFFDRRQRSQFRPREVPWLLLRWRGKD